MTRLLICGLRCAVQRGLDGAGWQGPWECHSSDMGCDRVRVRACVKSNVGTRASQFLIEEAHFYYPQFV